MEAKKEGNEMTRLMCAWRVFISLPTCFLSLTFIESRVMDGRSGPASLQAKIDRKQIDRKHKKDLSRGV